MEYNINMSEDLAILWQGQSASVPIGSPVVIGPFLIANIRRVLFILDIAAEQAGTVAFKVQACTTSDGTFTDLAGAAIASVVTTGPAGAIPTVEVKSESVEALHANANWIQGLLTVSGSPVILGVIVLGTAGYGPASDFSASGLVNPKVVV